MAPYLCRDDPLSGTFSLAKRGSGWLIHPKTKVAINARLRLSTILLAAHACRSFPVAFLFYKQK